MKPVLWKRGDGVAWRIRTKMKVPVSGLAKSPTMILPNNCYKASAGVKEEMAFLSKVVDV